MRGQVPRRRVRCVNGQMCGGQLLILGSKRVAKGTLWTNNMASRATASTTETVALVLRELALSQGDQEGLSEFFTDYFASDNHEFNSGK